MAKTMTIAFAFAVAVWANCGAIMGVGPNFMSMEATLVVHAIGGPVGAAIATLVYYRYFGDLTPLRLATLFVGTALVLDAFLVAPFFVGNFGMFASPFGLWIPMALIFITTWVTGALADGHAPIHTP